MSFSALDYKVLPFDFVNVPEGIFTTTRLNSFIYTSELIVRALKLLKEKSKFSHTELIEVLGLEQKHIEHLVEIGVLHDYESRTHSIRIINNITDFDVEALTGIALYDDVFFAKDISEVPEGDMVVTIDDDISENLIHDYRGYKNPISCFFLLGNKLYISNIYDSRFGSPCPNCILQHSLFDNSINGENPIHGYRNIFDYLSRSEVNIPKSIPLSIEEKGLVSFYLAKTIKEKVMTYKYDGNTRASLQYHCVDLSTGLEESDTSSHWEVCECLAM